VFALLDADDAAHGRAHRALLDLRERGATFVCSDHVVAEAYTLARVRLGWSAAQDALAVIDALTVRIMRGNPKIMTAARGFSAWSDQGFSFVDCISFAWMQELGIVAFASFDRHFLTAGFKAAPGV